MKKKNKVDMLNVLRFIAFMMVFLLHTKIFVPTAWAAGVSKSWVLYTPAWSGVWIFFILAGYGIGNGFYNGKYKMTADGIGKYYIKRIASVLPIYWFYLLTVLVFIKPDLLLPNKENLGKIISLFFFGYQEEFNSVEFGLSWYLTTLVRLYFVAPIGFLLFRKIKTQKGIYALLISFIIAGFVMRIVMGYHIAVSGEGNWSADIYKPFYFNLDMFFSGFLISGLKGKTKPREGYIGKKILCMAILLALIIYNSYIYFGASYNGWDTMNIYCYILPTVYICVISMYIYFYDVQKQYIYETLSWEKLRQNILRIFDYFNKVQLPMYLFHSSILFCLSKNYNNTTYMKLCAMFHVSVEKEEFIKGCIFTVEAFLITLIWAITVHVLLKKYTHNIINYFEQMDIDEMLKKWKKKILIAMQNLFPL